MSRAEKFIEDYTRNCSNQSEWGVETPNKSIIYVQPWLTPDQARCAVEIAREETLQEVRTKLLHMLNTSIDNKQFFEQLDDYIEELQTSNEL